MEILNLVLSYKWYDMIASGEKKEEYREYKRYWRRRFSTFKNAELRDLLDKEYYKRIDIIRFHRGRARA